MGREIITMKTRPVGLFLIAVFLILGVCMLCLSAFTLLFPGTGLDVIWEINPDGHKQMMVYSKPVGIGMLALAIFFIVAITGWNRRKMWGWWCVTGIFIANGIGDIARMFTGDIAGGILGIVVAGLIVFYLTRPGIKQLFS